MPVVGAPVAAAELKLAPAVVVAVADDLLRVPAHVVQGTLAILQEGGRAEAHRASQAELSLLAILCSDREGGGGVALPAQHLCIIQQRKSQQRLIIKEGGAAHLEEALHEDVVVHERLARVAHLAGSHALLQGHVAPRPKLAATGRVPEGKGVEGVVHIPCGRGGSHVREDQGQSSAQVS